MNAINYPHDRQRLVDLLLAHRAATDVRLYPTIWRVLLLLTSRVWEAEKDVILWEDADGELVGFAMLWRRRPTSPYLVLDWFIHPSQVPGELARAILEWGSQRAQEIATKDGISLTLYTNELLLPALTESAIAKESLPTVIASEAKQPQPDFLTSLGFLPVPLDSEEQNVYFARSLQGSLPTPELPQGYTLRHLHEMEDLAAYESLYGFAKVDPDHQKELLTSNEYCCLVVANPAGEFVAYCECSIWRAEWERTIRRIGWIDYVETKESERGKGLGRAALMAGLAQLQSWGAETAMLVTINTNTAAVRLYEKSGFKQVDVEEPVRYEKQVEP